MAQQHGNWKDQLQFQNPITIITVGVCLASGTALAGALYFPEMSSASESSYAGAGMVARAKDAGTAFSHPADMTRFDKSEMLAGATASISTQDLATKRSSS